MSAEIEARRTMASAALADFRRELASAPLSRPPAMAVWALRLADVLGTVLDVEPEGAGDDGLDDGTEPYCITCGSWCGMFIGLDGWHHFRGDPAPGGKRELYDPGHPAAVGWTRPQILAPGEVSTVLDALEFAAEYRRYRASLSCEACARHPAELCPDHETDLDRANDYDAVAGTLRSER